MTVLVDRRMLDELLGPRAKVIFAATDAPRAQTLLKRDEAMNNVEWAAYHPGSGDQTPSLRSVVRTDADRVSLMSPPTGLCVLAALSEQGRSELDEFVSWWKAHGGDDPPPILDLQHLTRDSDQDGRSWEGALYHHLFRLVWEAAKRSETRQVQLNSQLYELRTEYEQARNVLLTLQGYLDRLHQCTFELIHVLSPSSSTISPAGATGRRVQQLLPSSAEGLAAFDLYSVPQEGARVGEGHLTISLQARETGRLIGSWQIPYEKLGHGWFRCTFPVAQSEPLHHLDLVVLWHTLSGRAPSLGLAKIGAYHEMSAIADGRKLDQSLAMLVWGAVPGTLVRLPNDSWFDPPGDEPATGAIEYRLTYRDIARMRALSKAHFPYLHPLGDVPGFRLHPLDQKVAAALLTQACLPGTDRLVAMGQIRMPEARYPVEYAMCLTDSAAKVSAFPADPRADRRVLGFSGWQPVPADGQPHAIFFELDRPTDVVADLLFATRMTGGHSMTHHWADWLAVRIRLRHAVITGCERPTEP